MEVRFHRVTETRKPRRRGLREEARSFHPQLEHGSESLLLSVVTLVARLRVPLFLFGSNHFGAKIFAEVVSGLNWPWIRLELSTDLFLKQNFRTLSRFTLRSLLKTRLNYGSSRNKWIHTRIRPWSIGRDWGRLRWFLYQGRNSGSDIKYILNFFYTYSFLSPVYG